MSAIINLYSDKQNDIKKFLKDFYQKEITLKNNYKWEKEFNNPIDCIEIISSIIDNNEEFKINAWLSIDDGVFINVTNSNLDKIIRYLYERYPH